ncbi:MAG: PD-(D/E)XK nuclease family protein [Casimicrobium sp.]
MTSDQRIRYLCPSDRAARAIQRRLAQGSLSPPICVDFERFCADLWRRSQLFGLIQDPRELLDADASAALWRSLVSDETSLMAGETARIATLADDAWTLAHRYALSIGQIATLASGHDNIALFSRCAVRMEAVLRRAGAITQSELYALLLQKLDAIQSLLPQAVVQTPSFTVHAGQKMLLSAMSEHGVSVTRWAPESRSDRTIRAHKFSDEQQEMRTAITWAKSLATNSDSVIAIIVPNLAQCRAKWMTALREQLNPDQWWLDPETDRARFNLSIGESIATYPAVASLLTVLGATSARVDTEVLAQALMHPRWGRGPKSLQQMQSKLWRLLRLGADRCTLHDWLDVLPPALAARLDATSNAKKHTRESHYTMLMTLVIALTEHPWIAKSDLFQLEDAWAAALRRWTLMDRWLPPLSWREAVSEITRLAGQQTFQPQSGRASIQVIGLLESAGVPLDAAWIVGFTDRVLPEAYEPHPMLPRAWQAAAQVGLGSRDEVRRRADALWANWNLLCDELHVSYASEIDGSAQRISPLAEGLVKQTLSPSFECPTAPRRVDSVAFRDESLPIATTSTARLPLTAGMLEQQSHCPRKAAAARLNLREWPEYAVGIPGRLRGKVVHAVMHAVGAVRIQQTRANGNEPTLEMLRHVASEAFELAVQDAKLERPGIPASVWTIERNRLLPLIDEVLELDAARSGFSVVAVEQDVKAEVLGSAFKLRLDRRDVYSTATSDDARYGVVFDYKTGQVSRADWFAENSSGRLAAPQLPLYLFALHAVFSADEARIGAIGYIVISDDDVKFVGVGADPALNSKRVSANEPAWPVLTQAWQDEISVLVQEHRAGVADVAPLEGTATCRYCSFAGFCREPWSLAGGQDTGEVEDSSSAGAEP